MKIEKPDNAIALVFKHEDDAHHVPIGPVWFKLDDDSFKPMVEDEPDFTGAPAPAWFDVRVAEQTAAAMGLPFYEV